MLIDSDDVICAYKFNRAEKFRIEQEQNRRRWFQEDNLRSDYMYIRPERTYLGARFNGTRRSTRDRKLYIGANDGVFYVNQNGNRTYLTPEQKMYRIRYDPYF